jgi:hypothetical protein
MSNPTKTLSVRVPLDVANRIETLCLQRNINRNQLLQECIASEGIVGIKNFSKGGSAEPMPEILNDVLVGIGCLSTGAVVYHLLLNNLPKTWNQETRELVSLVSAISSGLGLAYGFNKIIKK